MKPKSFLSHFLLGTAIAALLAATAPALQAQTWSGATSGAWLTTTNWVGGEAAGSTTVGDTDIAVFTNNTNTTNGISFNTTGGVYHLGALDFTSTTNATRTVNNSSTTAGILTLNGATVNSVANTIIRNASPNLKNITNGSGAGTMGLALGNTTNNVVQVTGAGNIVIASIISGASDKTLTKAGTGAGSLTLGGANTYSGVTNVNQGTLLITHNTALGSTAANTIVASGATAYIGAALTAFAEPLNITGTGVGGTTGAFRIGGGGSTLVQGAVTLGGNATIASDGGVTPTFTGGFDTAGNALTFNTSGTFTISTAGISGVNGSLINNAGTLSLNVASTYSGGTTVAGGTLNIGNATALGSTSGQLTVNTGGTLNLNNNTVSIGNLTGTGGTIQGGAAGTRILTIGEGNTGGGNFQGVINDGTGTTALTKTGTGTIILSGSNGYAGATKVSGGTLVVNNTIASSATTVETTGVITGTGVLGSSLTVKSTGVINAGTVGTINTTASVTGATSFEAGSIFSWDLSANGLTGDKLNTASVTGSDAIFRILLANGTVNDSFFNIDRPDFFADTNIISSASDLTALFSSVQVYSALTNTAVNISSRGSFTLTSNGVSFTAVPEPTSALAGLLLAAGLLRRRRN